MPRKQRSPSPHLPDPDQVEDWRTMMACEALYDRLEVHLSLEIGERIVVTELKRWLIIEEYPISIKDHRKVDGWRWQLEAALCAFDRASKDQGYDAAPAPARMKFNTAVVQLVQRWMYLVADRVKFTANELFWARLPTDEAISWSWQEAFPRPSLKEQEQRYECYRIDLRETIGEDLADKIEANAKRGADPQAEPVPTTNESASNNGPPQQQSSSLPPTPQYPTSDEDMELDQNDDTQVSGARSEVDSWTWIPGSLAFVSCAQCTKSRTECKLRLNGTTRKPSACERCTTRKTRCTGAVWWDTAREVSVVKTVLGVARAADESAATLPAPPEAGVAELRDEVIRLREVVEPLSWALEKSAEDAAQARAEIAQVKELLRQLLVLKSGA